MSEENNGGKKAGTVAIVLVGCACGGLVLIAMLGLVAAIAVPNVVSMQYKSKRAEVPMNLMRIKIAEVEYEQDYDVYVKCSAYPSTPTKTTQMWINVASGGFKTLDFRPDGDVRGSYMVSTTAYNFTATGISDVDGDGVYATYVATKSIRPILITPPDVY